VLQMVVAVGLEPTTSRM